MNLHEYQAKSLFAQYGWPVSEGYAVDTADEAVEAGQTDRAQHHDHEDGREDRRRLLEATELGDQTGVATVVDPTDEQEQRAGRDAVVDHLQQAAGQALGVEGEGADHDEAKVGDRGVGDETLEVLLHRRRNRAVDVPIVPRATSAGAKYTDASGKR